MANKDRIRFAILGARGIGKVHARILQSLDCEICAILGSSEKSSLLAADDFFDTFGTRPVPFHRIEDLLRLKPDGISLCTPWDTHFELLRPCLHAGIPVLCEKPLIWSDSITEHILEKRLKELLSANACVRVNTCNSAFADLILNSDRSLKQPSVLKFTFHTNGKHQNTDIAVDLLPHAISILLRFSDYRNPVSGLTAGTAQNTYSCSFRHGRTNVAFDFMQSSAVPRAMRIEVDGKTFERVQKDSGATYRVALADRQTGETLELPDPFETSISRFISLINVNNPAPWLETDLENLRLMHRIISNH